MASSFYDGDGEGPRYISPDHVYELCIHRRADDLVNYINSFPGAAGDRRCDSIKEFAKHIKMFPGEKHTGPSQMHQVRADFARKLAQECSLAAPNKVVVATKIASNSGLPPNQMASFSHLYIDPDHVHQLFINRRSQDLVDYVDSLWGAAGDDRCNKIKQFAKIAGQDHMELFEVNQMWADHVRTLAQKCSLATPGNVVDLTNGTSNQGHYSGRKLTNKVPGGHCHYVNPLDSSSYTGRIRSTSYAGSMPISSHLRLLEKAALYPSAYSRRMLTSHVSGTDSNVLNQPSAPNSVIPAVTPFPYQASTNDEFLAPMSLQESSNNAPVGVLQPGSEQSTPQEMIQNAQADGKEKRRASGIIKQEVKKRRS